MLKINCGMRFDAVEADAFSFKEYCAAGSDARGDQILNDFMLRVNGDALTADKIGEIDAVAGAVEAEFNAVVRQAFVLQARADAGLNQQVHCALLEDAGADARLDVVARV